MSTDPLHGQLSQNVAQLTEQYESLMSARAEMAELTVTARSKDHAVEVTVDARGALTGLRFLDNKHRTMGGQQLARSVMEAVIGAQQEGQSAAADRLAEIMGEITFAGVGVGGKEAQDLVKKVAEGARSMRGLTS